MALAAQERAPVGGLADGVHALGSLHGGDNRLHGAEEVPARVTAQVGHWVIALVAPSGDQLRSGTRYCVVASSLYPGVDVFDRQRCGRVSGWFTVHRVHADASGSVDLLDADFTQHCGRRDGPALLGTITYRHPDR